MKIINKQQIRYAAPYSKLIDALRDGFKTEVTTPMRHHHRMQKSNGEEDVLLLMPSWTDSEFGGVKLVNVVPGNSKLGLPAISASYLLFSMQTGAHLALLDGAEITSIRTACASALAADYLARRDARHLLLVGSGQVAQRLAHAYKAVRDIDTVRIWDINYEGACKLADDLTRQHFNATSVNDLEVAVKQADIISCATLASEPLVQGAWLQPGQHLDLIGSFSPHMRETNDAAMQRASVFVDTETALKESGDLLKPLQSGALKKDDIRGDLFTLCREEHSGRQDHSEITLFKAVGVALEDLVTATLVYKETEDGSE